MLQDNLPRFDELNEIRTVFENEIYGSIAEKRFDRKKAEDTIFELLTMSYVYGLEVAGLDLQRDVPVNREKMRRLFLKPTAGKNFIERLNDYVKAANDAVKAESAALTGEEPPANVSSENRQIYPVAESLVNDLSRLAETEAHRVLNEAILETALEYERENPKKKVMKTWTTMADDRVREPHEWLEGSTVPLDAYFYTDGDKALTPGGFNRADLNVNCRCILRIITEQKQEG